MQLFFIILLLGYFPLLIFKQLYDLANAFNEFYTNMAVKIYNNIQKTNTYFTELENDKFVWFFKCSELELLNLVRSLKTNYSSGPDNISSKDLKKIIYPIKKKLVSAIKNCLATGDFPSICKISKVIPIYKRLTSIFSKILEKVIKSRLVKYFELLKHQYGFQE